MFPYLSKIVVKEIQDKVLVSTVNENVVTNGAGSEISSLMPSNMEETDETILVHVKHASREHARILIKAVDSDAVIIAIANFNQLVSLNELWIEFGTAKLLRFIPIHQIARRLGPDKSLAFLFFHVFSGCDTPSSRSREGKKSLFLTCGHP